MNNSIKYQPNIKIFIKVFFITVLTSFLLTHNKCFGFSLFEGNKPDKGQWTVVNDTMIKARYNATANLLPDGNVLIMGEEEFEKPNVAEIFDPIQQKIIKTIPIKQHFIWHEVSAISLKNGDVYISYHTNEDKEDFKAAVILFDSKTYTFKNINNSFDGKVVSTTKDTRILLKNGHLLIVPRFSSDKRNIVIYDPVRNNYYKAIGTYPDENLSRPLVLENGDVILFGFFRCYIYKMAENKFEEYKKLPSNFIIQQLDSFNYMMIDSIKDSYSKATIYNINTNETKNVKNKIKTWLITTHYQPKTVLLDNGNLLITGMYLSKFRKGYSSYIYDKAKNKFYKISSPKIKIFRDTTHVRLPNGDILFVGGNHYAEGKKIQIYSYTHKEK